VPHFVVVKSNSNKSGRVTLAGAWCLNGARWCAEEASPQAYMCRK